MAGNGDDVSHRELPVDTIAAATGMGTATTLRRHFNRTVGVPPDTYRRTFRTRTRSGPNDSGQRHQRPTG